MSAMCVTSLAEGVLWVAPGTELLTRLYKKSSSGLSLTKQMRDFLECVCAVLSINTVSKGSL